MLQEKESTGGMQPYAYVPLKNMRKGGQGKQVGQPLSVEYLKRIVEIRDHRDHLQQLKSILGKRKAERQKQAGKVGL